MDRLESFELLCQYVTPVDVEVHQPGDEAIFKNHDWETILKLADEYLVTPSLYLGLQRRGLLKHLEAIHLKRDNRDIFRRMLVT